MNLPTMESSTPASSIKNSTHYDHLKKALPTWLSALSFNNRFVLYHTNPTLHPTLKNITPAQNSTFKQSLTQRWIAHNEIESALSDVLDAYTFAAPLLKSAIKAQCQLDLDVNEIFINLYSPTSLPVFGIQDSGASGPWRVSLLEAALHNFELHEGLPNAYLPDSGFISRPNERGQFRLRDDITAKLPIPQFVQLCRTLNIGARYNAHLKEHLGLNDRGKQMQLKAKIRDSHIADLIADSKFAVLDQHLLDTSHASLHSFISGMNGKEWQTFSLSLFSITVIGVLIFIPTHQRFIVVYTPHDPLHPIKEYPSIGDYIEALTARLKNDTYQQFFCRFVPHNKLGVFNSELTKAYYQVIIDTPNAPDTAIKEFGTTKTLIPLKNPELIFSTRIITDDLWESLYSLKLAKIFNDAKSIAVSTEAEDRKTREERWERLKSIGLDIFNAALFVVAPFVPVVGQLMMLQMAYQLIDDVYEGVHDWVEGKTAEAFDHLFAVLESGVQVGLFSVGAKIVGDLLPKPSRFVEGMKPVMCNDGQTRLWNAEISAYAHDITLPESAVPDDRGLHTHQNKSVIKISNTSESEYALVLDKTEHPEQYTAKHPTRPETYAPKIQHNGHGGWYMEGERPQTWEGPILMRRLGNITEGFSDTELENMRAITDTHEGVLRRIHMNHEPIPPLLEDTLTRFKIHKNTQADLARLRLGQAITPPASWLEGMPTKLSGWPETKALNIYADDTFTGPPHTFGNPEALPENTLKIAQNDVASKNFLPLIVDGLDQTELTALVGENSSKVEAVTQLQAKIADYADLRSKDIFDLHYASKRQLPDPAARLIENTFTQLPAPATQALLDTTSTLEQNDILSDKRIPLRVSNLAGELENQVRITRAQEGLFEPGLLTSDAEKLTINLLKIHTDAISDIQLEVRDLDIEGTLRCAHSPEGATSKRILVRLRSGQYEVYDDAHLKLTPASSYYSALLKSLPSDNLKRLKQQTYPAKSFKIWLSEKYENKTDIRTALDISSVNTSVARETEQLLGGASTSRVSPVEEVNPLTERVQSLYPTRDSASIDAIVSRIVTEQDVQHLKSIEDEKMRLFETLDNWVFSLEFKNIEGMNVRSIQDERAKISHKIKDSWLIADKAHINEKGTIEMSAKLDLRNSKLGLVGTEKLILSNPLNHVSTLLLGDCKFSSVNDVFLHNFPNLRELSLASNELTRIPAALQNLSRLEKLSLTHNNLVMDSDAIAQLGGLKRLTYLDLSRNPLGTPPDISDMPELRVLKLNGTQIKEWPAGLFSHSRPATFDLNLLNNSINTVPECQEPSAESWLVANTRLERQKLDLDSEERLLQYRRAHGLDPHRTYPPRGNQDSAFWLSGSSQKRSQLQARWNNLENEHGSQGFFEIIARMEVDERAFQTQEDLIGYEEDQKVLTAKVWRLIDAATDDTDMRNKLFTLATSPTNCADAGAQTFNAMGLETMAYEYYEAKSTPLELEKNLITLARGKSRLNKIYDIARADVAKRIKPISEGGLGQRLSSEVIDGVPGTVDEVEVHTGYQSRLSSSLELPWVPSYMVYRLTAAVGEKEFTLAYRLIKEGEKGDGLINQILEVPFWDTYLTEAYPTELNANARVFDEHVEWLDELQTLQQNWVDSGLLIENRSASQKALLSETAKKLKIDEADILTQDPMSESLYNRIYGRIADERKEVSRQLTRQALTKARLI